MFVLHLRRCSRENFLHAEIFTPNPIFYPSNCLLLSSASQLSPTRPPAPPSTPPLPPPPLSISVSVSISISISLSIFCICIFFVTPLVPSFLWGFLRFTGYDSFVRSQKGIGFWVHLCAHNDFCMKIRSLSQHRHPLEKCRFHDCSNKRIYDILRFLCFSSWRFSATMDVTRVTSPPSIHVNDFNGQHGSYRATSKPSAMPYSGNRAPMTIPGSRGKPAPPPLPPPTHPHLVAGSYDLGWEMGNMSGRGGFGKGGGSVSSESSLRGNWNRKRADERVAERPDFIRRGSSISTVRSPVDLDTKHDFSRHQDEGYYSISETQSVNYQSVLVFPFGCSASTQTEEKAVEISLRGRSLVFEAVHTEKE